MMPLLNSGRGGGDIGWNVHLLGLFYHSIFAVPEYIAANSTKLKFP